MKKIIFVFLLVPFLNEVNAANENKKYTAEGLIDQQIVAYNAGDIDAFMATYADDVQLFNFPNKEITSGFMDMKIMYKNLFKNNPDLKAEVTNKIIQGGVLVYHERIFGLRKGGEFDAIAIYEVVDKKIQKVTFIQ